MTRRGRTHGARLDVAVVGGGVVGTAAALALARLGLEVALVESLAPSAWSVAHRDLRVYAFAPDNAALLDESAWLARLQRAFGWRAGRFLGSGPRSAYPVARVVARHTTAERAVLVGNAAQTVHPIGAQGFNLGLRDALTLAELIEADLADRDLAERDGADPGSAALLAAYVQRRQEDRERTLAFSDGLAKLTANPASMLRPVRGLGLMVLDQSPAMQALLVGGALGYRGDVPRLCRGDAT